jgi:hypothetical protein
MSVIAYAVHSKLLSVSGGHLLHQQPWVLHAVVTTEPLSLELHIIPNIKYVD